jgi:hypothetical protein
MTPPPLASNSEVSLLVAQILYAVTVIGGFVLIVINSVALMRDYLQWYGKTEDRRYKTWLKSSKRLQRRQLLTIVLTLVTAALLAAFIESLD